MTAALDGIGGLLGVQEFAATPAGYMRLLGWLQGFGTVALIGIEGTGSYGAGLARYFAAAGIRALMVAKRTARAQRTQTINQARALIITGPDGIRTRFTGQTPAGLAALRPRPGEHGPLPHPAGAARAWPPVPRGPAGSPGRADHAAGHGPCPPDCSASSESGRTPPRCCSSRPGDNPGRLRSEAAWAHLCAAAPIPASLGKVARYRLNRGGDRQANHALWRIVLAARSVALLAAGLLLRPGEGVSGRWAVPVPADQLGRGGWFYAVGPAIR
jgi:transposase